MSRHKAAPDQSPLLLVLGFVLIAGLLFGLFKLVGPGGDDTADVNAVLNRSTPSDDARSPQLRVQEGETLEPSPAATCEDVDVDTDITVLSYNIKSARISGGIGTFLGIIRSSGADIVLLQEVDKNRSTSGHVDQAGWLAANLGGWSDAFGTNVDYGGGLYGTAIISRFPIVSYENTHLPNGPGGQQRGLLHAVVDVDGVELSLYDTHLQNKIDYLKVRQAQAIAPIIAADDRPKVLAGDFNSQVQDTPLRTIIGGTGMHDTWGAVGVGSGLTHPSSHPRGRIDLQLYGGDGLTAITSSVLATTASDHRPVRAEYTLSGASSKVCGDLFG
ncbi:endonuclease/exonuclease/phosphatase family protein [Nocardioides panacisoli]|uniref:Endonuclease/exonuclease/phosphatase family protein n=1 Tax=Nocardioides panacisoli TaxID=627624 RepID=A0ABP7IT59_9ACTN